MNATKSGIILILMLFLVFIWLAFKPLNYTLPDTESLHVTDGPGLDSLKIRISQLEETLNQEQLQRQSLEQRLNQLELILQQDETEISQADQVDPVSPETSQNNPSQSDNRPVQQKLLALGMASETIQAMKQIVDRHQLEMLELSNRAQREGWDDTAEYSEQMQQLSNPFRSLQQEFGDEAYDLYLYASGIPNRVEIREVYSGSAADQAGLQPGDILLSYASRRIYAMSELRQATVEGEAGETVLIELLRDGQPVISSVPRGPLGISMSLARVKPE